MCIARHCHIQIIVIYIYIRFYLYIIHTKWKKNCIIFIIISIKWTIEKKIQKGPMMKWLWDKNMHFVLACSLQTSSIAYFRWFSSDNYIIISKLKEIIILYTWPTILCEIIVSFRIPSSRYLTMYDISSEAP